MVHITEGHNSLCLDFSDPKSDEESFRLGVQANHEVYGADEDDRSYNDDWDLC